MPAKPKPENPASDDGGFDDSYLDQSESARPVEIDSEGAFSSGAAFEAQRPEEIKPDRPPKSSRPEPVEREKQPSHKAGAPSGNLVGFIAGALSLLAIGGLIAEHIWPKPKEAGPPKVQIDDQNQRGTKQSSPDTPSTEKPSLGKPDPVKPPDERAFAQAMPDEKIRLLKGYNTALFTQPRISPEEIDAGTKWANEMKKSTSGEIADMLDLLIKKMDMYQKLTTSKTSASVPADSLRTEVPLPIQSASLQLALLAPGVASICMTALYLESTPLPTPISKPDWVREKDQKTRSRISKHWAAATKLGDLVYQSNLLCEAGESAWNMASKPAEPADWDAVQYYLVKSLILVARAGDDPTSNRVILGSVTQRLASLHSRLAQKAQEELKQTQDEIDLAKKSLESIKKEINEGNENIVRLNSQMTTLQALNEKNLNAKEFQRDFASELGRELGPNGKLAAIEKLKGGELVTMPQLQASVTSAIRSFVDMDILRQAVGLAKRVGELSAKQTRMEGKFTTAVDKLDSATAGQNRELQSAKNDLEKAQTNLEVVNKKIGKLEAINSGQLLTATKDAVNAVLARLDNWGYRPLQIPDPDRPSCSSSDLLTPAQAEKSGESFDLGYQAYFSERPGAQREAVRHLAMACRLEPRSALYRYFLGMTYYRLGDRESAAAEIRCGTELEERNSDTVEIYKGLEREQGTPRQWMEHVREVVRTEFKKAS